MHMLVLVTAVCTWEKFEGKFEGAVAKVVQIWAQELMDSRQPHSLLFLNQRVLFHLALRTTHCSLHDQHVSSLS
jgi:hypothetical protein